MKKLTIALAAVLAVTAASTAMAKSYDKKSGNDQAYAADRATFFVPRNETSPAEF